MDSSVKELQRREPEEQLKTLQASTVAPVAVSTTIPPNSDPVKAPLIGGSSFSARVKQAHADAAAKKVTEEKIDHNMEPATSRSITEPTDAMPEEPGSVVVTQGGEDGGKAASIRDRLQVGFWPRLHYYITDQDTYRLFFSLLIFFL